MSFSIPIMDMHCDLLLYLEKGLERTPYDLVARCAIPQLRQGLVQLQILPIFTKTAPGSSKKGLIQAEIYRHLPSHYPKDFVHFSSSWNWKESRSQIAILMAFENASGFCEEQEPLEEGLTRLHSMICNVAKPLYISLTWNMENRFGGGAWTSTGLKEDGKRLLDWLDRQGIAIDLSHASDPLAYEIIDYMEGRGLKIPLIASHSNARAVACVPRNLPDDIAKEIFRRGGVIGLNLCRSFIGPTEEECIKQMAYWLELGGEDHVVLGADFFYEEDLPAHERSSDQVFFHDYQNASCYGRLLQFLQKGLKLENSFLEKLARQNFLSFMKRSNPFDHERSFSFTN